MTAEEFLEKIDKFEKLETKSQEEVCVKAMKEFAKYHVEQALKEQGKLAKHYIINNCPVPSLEKLASAYPLENIK